MKQQILGLLVGGLVARADREPGDGGDGDRRAIEGQTQTLRDDRSRSRRRPLSVKGAEHLRRHGASGSAALDAADRRRLGRCRVRAQRSRHDLRRASLVRREQRSTGSSSSTASPPTTRHAPRRSPTGDAVLWFWSSGVAPYKADAGYDDPVLLTAPTTAVPGQAFSVTVRDTDDDVRQQLRRLDGVTPSAGATVSGGVDGGHDRRLMARRRSTVRRRPYTLIATKGDRAPARIVGCATTGATATAGHRRSPAPGVARRCGSAAERAARGRA